MLSSWSFIGCWICACTLTILVQRCCQTSEGQRGVFSLSSSSSSSSSMTPLYFFLFIFSSSGLPSFLPLTFPLCLHSSSPILSFLSLFSTSASLLHCLFSLSSSPISSFLCLLFTAGLLPFCSSPTVFSLVFSPRFFLSFFFPSPFFCLSFISSSHLLLSTFPFLLKYHSFLPPFSSFSPHLTSSPFFLLFFGPILPLLSSPVKECEGNKGQL